MTQNLTPDWVAVDWGTTHMRAWLMSDGLSVLDRRDSDQGMGRLDRDGFAPALTALLGDVLGPTPLPVIVCGMAGSRQGWAEAPYVATPCAAPGVADATRISLPQMNVHILPGVKQMSPADVMRGEETQIAGFLAAEPKFDGVLCLPGTHNKWVRISAEEIVGFRTFMTGEVFALLSDQSVLRHSVTTEDWDDAAFAEALNDTMARPSDLAGTLFSLRAETLLHDLSPAAARARLSGVLIGAELAAAKPYWLGQDIAILGEAGIARAYEAALLSQGAMVRRINADSMTLAGLTAAYKTLKATPK